MNDLDLVIGKNVAELLHSRKVKQTELANHLNVPRQTVNKMLIGKRSFGCGELKSIAAYFCVTIDDLMNESKTTNYQENVSAYFMGEISNKKTKNVLELVERLTDIYVDQINANKKKNKNVCEY